MITSSSVTVWPVSETSVNGPPISPATVPPGRAILSGGSLRPGVGCRQSAPQTTAAAAVNASFRCHLLSLPDENAAIDRLGRGALQVVTSTQVRKLMVSPTSSMLLMAPPSRSNWVRLRTLIVLRWIAIAGQLVAITVATRSFQPSDRARPRLSRHRCGHRREPRRGLCLPRKQAAERRARRRRCCSFDITQLCFLLFLTGGAA